MPDWAEIIFGTGITLGSLTAILLNLLFHHVGKGFGPAVAGQPGDSIVRLDQVNKMTPRGVRRHLRPACSRGRAGSSSAPGRCGRSPTPTPCARSFQEALFSGSPEEQRELIESYPQLGSQFVADGLERRGVAEGPGRAAG